MLIHNSFKFISIVVLVGVQLFSLGIISITLADDLSDRQPKADNATQRSARGGSAGAPPQAQVDVSSDEHLDDHSDTQATVNSDTHPQKPEQEGLDPKDDGVYHPPLTLGYPNETMSSGTR